MILSDRVSGKFSLGGIVVAAVFAALAVPAWPQEKASPPVPDPPAARELPVNATPQTELTDSSADQPVQEPPSAAPSAESKERSAEKQEAKNPTEQAPTPDLKAEWQFDFRGGNFDRDQLVPVGNLSLYGWQLLKPEPRGLRIIIPHHQGKERPTLGVAPTFTIHGDFEITTSYELVAADAPKTPIPVGGQIYILAQNTLNGASILRGVADEGQHRYFLFWAVRDAGGRRPVFQSFPAETRRGKLRFCRTGELLRFFVAEENTPDFRELAQAKFGTEPIGLFRVESITNGQPCSAETLWDRIEIRAEKLVPFEIPIHKATDERAAAPR